METVYLMINQSFFIAAMLAIALMVLLIVVLIRGVIIEPMKSEIPYRCWPWTAILLYQVIPGVFLAIVIGYILYCNFGIMKCTYQWHHGDYQIVEGTLEELTVEEFRRSGDIEPNFDCSFRVGSVYFPPTNDYTQEEAEALAEASYVKIYYLYDGDTPCPWRIDVATTP